MEKKIPMGILKVLILNFVVSGLLLFVVAFLAYQLHFQDENMQVGAYCIYAISNLLGGILIGKVMGNRKFLWGLIEGVLYFVVLLILSLILSGSAAFFSLHTLSVLLISMICGMLGGIIS